MSRSPWTLLPRRGPPPRGGDRTARGVDRHHVSSTLLAVAAFGTSALAAALVLTASDATGGGAGRAALHLSLIAAPVAAGLVAIHTHHSERFGRLLIVVGLVWSLTVLSESADSLVYSTGRVIGWLTIPLLVYVMLAFPDGHLKGRRDQALFRAVLAIIVVLYLASALVVERYPLQTPWTSCGADCPANAFMLFDAEPAFVGDVLEPARDTIGVLLLIAVTVALAVHMRAASAIRRVMAAPVLAVSIAATLLLAAFIVVRRVSPDTEAAETIGVVWALCLPAMAAAFSAGLVRRQLFIGNVLTGLSVALSGAAGGRALGPALRAALGDRAGDVLVRDRERGRWVHEDGTPADPGALAATGMAVRGIGDRDEPIATVVLDADVDADDDLLDAIVALIDAALRGATLRAELQVSLDDLDDSRKRIATAADLERRRIERDLHDGAQQHLIALRMRLALAEDLLKDDPASGSQAVHDLGGGVDDALEEVRSLARGIYPPVLADRGLVDALTSAGRRCPLPVDVRASGVTRHAPEIESAVYFACLEALQNVVKHARGATCASISLRQGSALGFEVSDDGAGFAVGGAPRGDGMRNMRDRVEPLGGRLSVTSSRFDGTVVRGSVPLPAPAQRRGRFRSTARPPAGREAVDDPATGKGREDARGS
jgi:signal transduction histidine kinase